MNRLATYFVSVALFALMISATYAQDIHVTMTEMTDPDGATLRVFQMAVEGAGHTCEKALHVFSVDDGSHSDAFYKVVCSGDLEWQVTIIGNDNYVKPWTGTLLGR